MNHSKLQAARVKAEKLGLNQPGRRILICLDERTASCASAKQMRAAGKHLKQRLKELGLSKRGGVVRIKTACVGICKAGPIIGIEPDGVWYGGCTPEVIDQIIQRHLVEGQVVEAYRIAGPTAGSASQ